MTISTLARTLTGVTALCLIAACNQAPKAGDSAKVSTEIKTTMASLISSFNTRDAEKAVSYDAPDYVGMFHGVDNVVGPAQDLALTKLQLSDAAAKVTVSDEKVDVAAAGDMAVWSATYAYDFTDPKTKKPTTEHGNWLIVFKKQVDGAMKEAYGVVSDTPASAPVAK